MQFIKAKYIRNGVPAGRSYKYKTDADLKPGDMVISDKGAKLIVVDESVDAEWIKAYGAENIGVVERAPAEESEGI